MANNPQNLVNFTTENASEAGRRGAAKTNEIRRKKRKLKDALEIILELPASTNNRQILKQLGIDDDQEMTNQMLLAVAAFQKALKGDVRAMEFIRDTTENVPMTKLDEAKAKLAKAQAKLITTQIQKEIEAKQANENESVVIINDCPTMEELGYENESSAEIEETQDE